ncbi:glycosyltransferase family 8 protein [Devosia geojensis]|uniref:glycosyltransferase family 8 protein n=1 Tax=Devosia geojensis TaxID=443610 RepID=UPI0006972551|nr:glycosyltransferase family 8 protein [Devosia geojensis]
MSALNVTLAFDDNFWAPAYAVMRSVCLTSARRSELVFHLCEYRVSAEHRRTLDAIAEEFGARVIHITLEDHAAFNAVRERLPVPRRLHPVIYARLLLPAVLGNVERVLYLDCDTMAVKPVEQLVEADMAGRTIAAVPDAARLIIAGGRQMREKRDLFDLSKSYFNSGVLLIDLPRFAAADVPGRIEALIADGTMNRLYYDQDLLNLIFADDWRELDWRYNVVDPRQPHETLGPHIVHYTGERRPWHLLAGLTRSVAFARAYRHVMTDEVFYRFMRERWKRWWLGLLRLR